MSGSFIDTPNIFYLPEERLGGILNFRWIPEKPDNGKIFTSLRYEINQDLTVGLDYRPLTDNFSFAANWRVISEQGDWKPAIILGTANDDFNDIDSQSYYATASKFLGELAGFQFSPYAGATYIDELSDLRPVAGLNVRKGVWSVMYQYSGTTDHLSISRQLGRHTASLVLWGMEKPGIAWTYRF